MSFTLLKSENRGRDYQENPFSADVTVDFIDGLTLDKAIEKISKIADPQIILWYVGCYGLKEKGVSFYRDSLISTLLSLNRSFSFWLVDLTAWGAFHNIQCSIDNTNSCCEKLENFLDGQFQCIKSAEFFKYIQELSDLEIINYFKRALRRKFISEASKFFLDKNILVSQIFNGSSLLMSDFLHQDTSKAYSVFQYFEGCWLVDQIFSRIAQKDTDKEIQLVFALPNDEIKYYRDKDDSFEKDLTFLISKRCEELKINSLKIKITFISFPYGLNASQRPYNARGKSLKPSQISLESVCGENWRKDSYNEDLHNQFVTL